LKRLNRTTKFLGWIHESYTVKAVKTDCRFPYPHLRTYLLSREQYQLARFVPWCGAFCAKPGNNKLDHQAMAGFSKNTINALRPMIEHFGSKMMRMKMITHECYVRMISGCSFGLFIVLRPFLVVLAILMCFKGVVSIIHIVASEHKEFVFVEKDKWLKILIFYFIVVVFTRLLKNLFVGIVHNLRKRELLVVLGYANILYHTNDEFKDVFDKSFSRLKFHSEFCQNCKHCHDYNDCTESYTCTYADEWCQINRMRMTMKRRRKQQFRVKKHDLLER